jgi:DNA-binding CsgD family transcriptional regulator
MKSATPMEASAIMAVIKAEHEAFWMQDQEGHARCHVQGPDTWFWSYWRHGGLAIRHGWDEIGTRSRQAMAAFVGPSPSYAFEATWEGVVVHVDGDLAWATYDQRYPSSGGPINGLRGATSLAHELRILEKHDGEWKIALVSVMIPGLDQLDGPVLQLAADGTIIWKSEHAGARLADDDDLVIRNGRLRIRNRTADQKLQLAIQWAASLDGFLMSRRGSVPIVMDAGEGLPTKLWWLIGESGTILFSFGNGKLAEDRLAMAAPVFGLSPSQLHLATRIVEGRSLSEIARERSVSVNTARTQLRRMFEKVGVHSQPALVRVLLSVAAPR